MQRFSTMFYIFCNSNNGLYVRTVFNSVQLKFTQEINYWNTFNKLNKITTCLSTELILSLKLQAHLRWLMPYVFWFLQYLYHCSSSIFVRNTSVCLYLFRNGSPCPPYDKHPIVPILPLVILFCFEYKSHSLTITGATSAICSPTFGYGQIYYLVQEYLVQLLCSTLVSPAICIYYLRVIMWI